MKLVKKYISLPKLVRSEVKQELTGITIGKPLSDSSAVCSKYSSQMRLVHSIQASRGRAGFETSRKKFQSPWLSLETTESVVG